MMNAGGCTGSGFFHGFYLKACFAVMQSTTWMCLMADLLYAPTAGQQGRGWLMATHWQATPLNRTGLQRAASKLHFDGVQI